MDQSCPRGMGTMSTRGYDNGTTYSEHGHGDRVLFLTDKCNALALRLQQVEAQLLNDRVAGDLVVCQPGPSSERDDAQGVTTANPRLYPRTAAASGGLSSSSHGTEAPRIVAAKSSSSNGDGGGGGGGGCLTGSNITTDGTGPFTAKDHPELYHSASTRKTTVHSPSSLRPGQGIAGRSFRGVAIPNAAAATVGTRGGGVQSRTKQIAVDAEARHCERVESEIAKRFDIVTDSLEKLENVFSGAAQILEHRVRAITTISRQAYRRAMVYLYIYHVMTQRMGV